MEQIIVSNAKTVMIVQEQYDTSRTYLYREFNLFPCTFPKSIVYVQDADTTANIIFAIDTGFMLTK
jgi:hypothetical protein